MTPDPLRQVYETLMQPSEAVTRSMAALLAKTAALGSPRLEGRDRVADKDVPVLLCGRIRKAAGVAVKRREVST